MAQYKSTKLFADSLEEFDHAEEVVKNLIEEYAAAEKADYIDWGAAEDQKDGDEGMDY
jgi:tubulin gamma